MRFKMLVILLQLLMVRLFFDKARESILLARVKQMGVTRKALKEISRADRLMRKVKK